MAYNDVKILQIHGFFIVKCIRQSRSSHGEYEMSTVASVAPTAAHWNSIRACPL
jgi:hypothetical protein